MRSRRSMQARRRSAPGSKLRRRPRTPQWSCTRRYRPRCCGATGRIRQCTPTRWWIVCKCMGLHLLVQLPTQTPPASSPAVNHRFPVASQLRGDGHVENAPPVQAQSPPSKLQPVVSHSKSHTPSPSREGKQSGSHLAESRVCRCETRRETVRDAKQHAGGRGYHIWVVGSS